MRFAARAEVVDGFRTVRLSDSETGAFCSLLPDYGGAVWRLSLAAAGSAGPAAGTGDGGPSDPEAILEADAPDEIEENPWFRGRLLVPFNDRIPRGVYRFGGREHRLATNDPGPPEASALHGLLYNQSLSLDDLGFDDRESSARLSYRINADAFAGYPFSPAVSVCYRLSPEGFELSIAVTNVGPDPAPVALGWHPYIRTPGGADAARLLCPADRYVEVDSRLLPTGNAPRVAGGPFDFSSFRPLGEGELDIALVRPSGLTVARTLIDRGFDRVEVEQSVPPFGYTQLFVPPDRSSIAVEPITAATDAFNRPELGLTSLAPRKTISGWVRIRRARRKETVRVKRKRTCTARSSV